MTSEGLTDDRNLNRGKTALEKTAYLAAAGRIGTQAPTRKARYVLETHLRSKYLYNALLIPNLRMIKSVGNEVDRNLV